MSAALWFEMMSGREWMSENTVMPFLSYKRINTELFIGNTASLYMGETQIRAMTIEGDQCIRTIWLEEWVYLEQKSIKGVGMKDQV